MTIENKSQKAFIAVTMLTVLSIVSVLTVYAVLIGTFYSGGQVTIGGGATGLVEYCENDTGPWAGTLNVSSGTSPWYSRLTISGGQYNGTNVQVTWTLQQKIDDDTWSNVDANMTTTVSLTTVQQYVFATADGSITGNRNWATYSDEGTYRVVATVDSTT